MPSAGISNTTAFTTYTMRVQAKNAIGKGPMSGPVSAQFNYNKATGGIEIPYTESDGSQWMMHKFTTNGTLVVTENPQPFKWRLIGAGGTSGYADCPMDHGRAGGGGGWHDTEGALPIGGTNIFVGQGGTSHANNPAPASSIEGLGHVGGGGHGCRGFYNSDWSAGGTGGWGGTSNGTAGTKCSTQYGTPGDPGLTARTLWNGEVGEWGKGGPARSHADCGANGGQSGVVAIAYRTG